MADTDDLFDEQFDAEFEESEGLGDKGDPTLPAFDTMSSAEFAEFQRKLANPEDPNAVDISAELAQWRAMSGEDLSAAGKSALAILQKGTSPEASSWLDAYIQLQRANRQAEESAKQALQETEGTEVDELAEGIDFMALNSADWAKVMETLSTGRSPQRLDGAEFNRRLANAFGKEVGV